MISLKPLIALALLAVACAPAAEASCHFCVQAAVESCSSLDADCGDDVEHLAGHADELALDAVDDPEGFVREFLEP